MKFPFRFMLLTVAMMLFGYSARAGSINEEQAKVKASSFLQTRHKSPIGKRLSPASMPIELHSTPTGKKALYVFNVGEQDGFVVVAGDDRVRPILGYADSGSFDAEKMPAALREMLAIYARQIDMLGQTQAGPRSAAPAAQTWRRISGTMADVAPLLTTTWNQYDPYNAYCPTLNDQTALTGCVATAMAQIAYYHRFPTSQVPSLAAYTSSTNKINVSAWGATTFDWDNMLDNYAGSYTNAQKVAVATLMRYCGQAAQMDYGFTSGAYNGDALYAFKEKLGYNANAEFKSAANYSIDGWEDLIYKEVSQGRPVYYSALNGDEGGAKCGGHAFVIDGYQADGNYFHVNWGWGGASNGYFNLFALDPDAPESAATATGWHYQMLAIIGLSPEDVNTAKLTQDASGSWLINSADDWNELSANLVAYNGGSFKLTNDITVNTMVGTENQRFSGTFDGQGHTITLAINATTTGLYGGAMFRFAQNATFLNMHITGSVTTKGNGPSSLVSNGSDKIIVENVTSDCDIYTDVDDACMGGMVGIVGENWSYGCDITFNNCAYTGNIIHTGSDAYQNNGGVFVGWKSFGNTTVKINNCYVAPKSLSDNETFSTFIRYHDDNDQSYINNSYYQDNIDQYTIKQGVGKNTEQFESGEVCYLLNANQAAHVWGQKIGTDATPVLTNDASKAVYKVSFAVDGLVVKTVFTNSPIGDKMPTGEEIGLSNATFTCNGAAFTSSTTFSSDITVNVAGTSAYKLTLGKTTNGSISINNNACIPGFLKKVTAIPAAGFVVSAIKVTDASGKTLPVTQVSNATNEYVFAFPKSSVTVTAEFTVGEAEPVQFINGGLTLPSSWRSGNQHWTADTWTIWGDKYNSIDNVIVGTPPTDALGHKWYEEGYALTNSDTDVQPNGNKIIWENHAASFKDGGDYDYFRATGANNGDRIGDFYIRRIFTFNTQTIPSKLYLSCSYDDSPVEYYINGTLVYEDHKTQSWHDDCYEVELTPEQIALIHTDGTPNVLAVHSSQNWGGYHLDCGLYDPTALSYEVTDDQTVSVQPNAFLMGDVIIPETMTYNGVTYTVTGLADEAFYGCSSITSVVLPPTLTNIGYNVFMECENLQYVKSYMPIYQDQTLIAAPVDATEFELSEDCSGIFRNAFKFTENLKTLTLPRSLTSIGDNAFVGCKSLTTIYAYALPVPSTEQNAFEGLNKSAITVHVYASALDSYKQSWGEEFNYVTMPDPQPITLTINVTNPGSFGTLVEEAAAEKGQTTYDVVGITVTGTLNYDDLIKLSSMCTGVYALATIDLSGATIEENSIGHSIFNDKEKLTSIKLPETLEYINEYAFYNCQGLTAIDIPASVKRIRSYAFNNCPNLVTVTGCEGLNDANAWDDWYVFGWTPNIEGDVYGGTTFLSLDKDATGEYEVPVGIKVIVGGAMHGRNITSVILPASVTDLGNDVFRGCHQLTDFYVYATTPPLCHNGSMEYDFDKSQATLHVPASAIEDYKNAEEWREFGRIVGIVTGELVDMTINVATAGTLNDALFDAAVAKAQISDKTLIRNLTVTGSLNADDIAYLNSLPNTLYNLDMLDMSGTTLEGNTITQRMFYTTLYKVIKLPSNVTSIAAEAFRGSRRLCEVTLPDALETIGSYAFAGSGLTSITIPDNVTEMGDRGLQSCTSLTSITLGNSLTNIPDCWAEFCDNLEEVTIGKRVKTIRWRAFYGGNIKNVYSYAKIPPSWNYSFYDDINEDAVLHTYSNNLNSYENASGWKNFPTIVGDLGTYTTYDIAVNVTTMGTFNEALLTAMAAVGCEDMVDINKLTVTGSINNDDLNDLRDNLGATINILDLGAVTVENNAFGIYTLSGCGFKELVLPNSLERLGGWNVLNNCANLKKLDIPSSVKSIGPDFCMNASSLEVVTGGEGIINIESWTGMHFANCPNLKTPVFFNNYFLRLPESTVGAYEVPETVTTIVRDAFLNIEGLTALTLPEGLTNIYGNAFVGVNNLKDISFFAVELPQIDDDAFGDLDRPNCTLHVYEEMVDLFQADEIWGEFNIVGDLGSMPNTKPINEADFAELCAIYNTLNGNNWTNKWIVNKNVQTASRWNGVTFDEEGYVTSIDLGNNQLSGDISSLTLSGLTKLTRLDLNTNAITGDIQPLLASLPKGCELNVEEQDFGYVGEHTLYEICNYGGLPSIAYYQSESGTLASTLIGVKGVCQFYHEESDGEQYWDCDIYADGSSWNNYKFCWPSPTTVECFYPHHFTFTYNYEMGDANMDDVLNVLDLQTTLNYSNGEEWGLFNFYAADTYGQDDDINVQDIVSTVNILLAQESSLHAPVRALGTDSPTESEAYVGIENGQIVLYTIKPVAALDLRLAGIESENLHWNTEAMGFATATSAQAAGTHAIIYSMQPRQISEGKTVLATFDDRLSPHLVSAVLSDSKARPISVGSGIPTGIWQMNAGMVSRWSLTDLSGSCVANGTHATEADILKLARSRQLHGVYILNMDGAKRKIVIK